MGRIAVSIKEKLTKAFNPSHLELIDESHKHAGHAGLAEHSEKTGEKHGNADDSGETHFQLTIRADAFEGMSLLARHRAIMEVLAFEMENGVHALSLKASA